MNPWRVFIVALLLSLGLLSPAAGQTEVRFAWKLKSGEVVWYAETISFQESRTSGDRTQRETGRSKASRVLRVFEVDPADVMLVEVALEHEARTFGGRRLDPMDSPRMFRLQPNGQVKERLWGADHMEYFPFPLPDRPVRIGDTWASDGRFGEQRFLAGGKGAFTLAEVMQAAEGLVARVRYRIEGLEGGPPIGTPNVSLGLLGSTVVTGEYLWGVDQARLLQASGELRRLREWQVVIQGQTYQRRDELQVALRQEILATPNIPVPQVFEDELIVPGKGIALVDLTAPMDQMIAKFGPGYREIDIAARSKVLIWPNGMGAYLDNADPTKIVALQTTDRLYRTERGLGVGSSQGAVLMSYGLSPTRLERQVAGHGGVRILIYNDLGIAFAVTSDAAHANRSDGHAPLGAVDWVIVFPPQTGEKLFPPP